VPPTGFSGHAGRNHHDFTARKAVFQLVRSVISRNLSGCADMRKVGCYTGRVHNVVQRELIDERVHLKKKRERLSDSAGSTEHGHASRISLQKGEDKVSSQLHC